MVVDSDHGSWREPSAELTDRELLLQVRSGSKTAYDVLFARHKDHAMYLAYTLAHDYGLAEDAVSEAFASVWRAIQAGAGPSVVFGPYLRSSVSRSVYRLSRAWSKERATADEDFGHLVDAGFKEEGYSFDFQAVRSAFRALPERWQEVIWYLDVDGLRPRHVAPLLGLSPNAVVALHRRAKSALRTEFLRQHLHEGGVRTHDKFLADLPLYVLGRLGEARYQVVSRHLASCVQCSEVLRELREVGLEG